MAAAAGKDVQYVQVPLTDDDSLSHRTPSKGTWRTDQSGGLSSSSSSSSLFSAGVRVVGVVLLLLLSFLAGNSYRSWRDAVVEASPHFQLNLPNPSTVPPTAPRHLSDADATERADRTPHQQAPHSQPSSTLPHKSNVRPPTPPLASASRLPVSINRTSAPSASDVFDLQSWVLSVLQPTAPRLLPHVDEHTPFVDDDGLTYYRNGGANYAMGSTSSRLQRLPRLSHRLNFNKTYGFRLPANPALVPHPIFPHEPSAGLFRYQLSIQLNTVGEFRNEDGGVFYFKHSYNKLVMRVGLTLTIHVAPDPTDPLQAAFQLSYQHEQVLPSATYIDQKLLPYPSSDDSPRVLAVDNWQGATLFRAVLTNDSAVPVRYEPVVKRQVLTYPAGGKTEKNYMPVVLGNGTIYYVSRFSPFTVLTCGTPVDPLVCSLHHEMSLEGSHVAAQGANHWRGTAALIPLPGFPLLLLGSVHQKYPKPPDHYNHRIILVDSQRLEPVAYTDPFGLFGPWKRANWFEFVVGMHTLERTTGVYELLLAFGYNDNEPWLAVLPLDGFMKRLKPVAERDAAVVENVKQHYS